MMACEEAWLLGQYIRSIDPQAVLVLGPVPISGADEVFKNSLTGQQTFIIKGEKAPNAAGIRRVMSMLGGPAATFDELVKAETPELKALKGGWIVGGYLSAWLPKDQPAVFKRGFRIVQDILPSALADQADVLLPAAAWAEKDGCWENYQNIIQPFAAAVAPAPGAMREGDVYYRLLGRTGLYNAQVVRQEMGGDFAAVQLAIPGQPQPVFEFTPL